MRVQQMGSADSQSPQQAQSSQPAKAKPKAKPDTAATKADAATEQMQAKPFTDWASI